MFCKHLQLGATHTDTHSPALHSLHRGRGEQLVRQQVNLLHDVGQPDWQLLPQEGKGCFLAGVDGSWRDTIGKNVKEQFSIPNDENRRMEALGKTESGKKKFWGFCFYMSLVFIQGTSAFTDIIQPQRD